MKRINLLIILLMGLAIIYLSFPKKKNVIENTEYSILRDSIYIVNDSIIEKIKYIEKRYNEEVHAIMSSSDSANYCIFSEYINHYNNQ